LLPIDRIRRSRRRTIALRIERDGSLTVLAPLQASELEIRQVVERHAGWIQKNQAKIRAKNLPLLEKRYAEGELFWFLGRQYPLHLVEGARKYLDFQDQFRLDRRALPNPQTVFIAWYRAQAKTILAARLAQYSTRYGFKYRQMRITSARKQWGSCNTRGTISFPWRLVMAPLDVIDYVVVHELVHTLEHNHGPRFWQQVAAIVPDYASKRKWLELNSPTMIT
jgi:hypothetical protein